MLPIVFFAELVDLPTQVNFSLLVFSKSASALKILRISILWIMVGYHMDNDGIGIVLILCINNEEYWLYIIWIMVGYHLDNDGVGIVLRYVKNFC